MSKEFSVYGIGRAMVDIQLQISDAEFSGLGLEKGGMQLVETDAQQALLDTFTAHDLHKASGGSAANTIIALAQLGAPVAYGCLVGQDALGAHYIDEMRSLGVAIDCAPTEIDVTGTCLILITPDAERTMNTHLGASLHFAPEHVSEEAIKNSEWLYVEGYLFTNECSQASVDKAIALAKKHGTKVAVTFSDGFIVDVFGEHLRRAVAGADLIFANANEAAHFAGVEDEQQAFNALKSACPNVVMTLSERGAHGYINDSEYRFSGIPTTAVDATGAGDIFAGGFLYGLTSGLSVQATGDLSCTLGSAVVSQLGPRVQGDIRNLPGVRALLS